MSFLLVAIAAGSAALFIFALDGVRDYSKEVNHRREDAEASLQQISGLQALKGKLSESESLVGKANLLFATQDNFQGQALTDIRNYANAADLTVANTKFESGDDGAQTVVVSFEESSVSYSKLIHFLENIEGNVPKMQVSSLPLTHIKGGGANSVEVKDIKIRIYVR